MATTADFRNGIILKFNNELHVLEEFQHRTPGNLRAFYQAKMRNIRNGRIVENRFRSGEEVEIIDTERKKFQYLYREGADYVFMDNQTYDQINIAPDQLGEQAKYIKEGFEADIVFSIDGEIIQIVLPTFVELLIVETTPMVRDDRATAGTKPAKLETGATINVPIFLTEGDLIKMDTRDGSYIERIKK